MSSYESPSSSNSQESSHSVSCNPPSETEAAAVLPVPIHNDNREDSNDKFLVSDSSDVEGAAALSYEVQRLRCGQQRRRGSRRNSEQRKRTEPFRQDLDFSDIADPEPSGSESSSGAEVAAAPVPSSSSSDSALDFAADADPEDSGDEPSTQSQPSLSPCVSRRRPRRTTAPITFHDAFQSVEPDSAVAREARATAEARRTGLRENFVDDSVPSYVYSTVNGWSENSGFGSGDSKTWSQQQRLKTQRLRALGVLSKFETEQNSDGPDEHPFIPCANLPTDWSGPQVEVRLRVRNDVYNDVKEFVYRCGNRNLGVKYKCLTPYDRLTAKVIRIVATELGFKTKVDVTNRVITLYKRFRKYLPNRHKLGDQEVQRVVQRAVDSVIQSQSEMHNDAPVSRNFNDRKGRAVHVGDGSSDDDDESDSDSSDSGCNSDDEDEVQYVPITSNRSRVDVQNREERNNVVISTNTETDDEQVLAEAQALVHNATRPPDKMDEWRNEILSETQKFAQACIGQIVQVTHRFPVIGGGNAVIPVLRSIALGLQIEMRQEGSFARPVVVFVKGVAVRKSWSEGNIILVVDSAIAEWRNRRDQPVVLDDEDGTDDHDVEFVSSSKRGCCDGGDEEQNWQRRLKQKIE